MEHTQRIRLKKAVKKLPSNIAKIIITLLFLFPFYWMLVTSVKPYIETIQFPPSLWPQDFTFDAYKLILGELNLLSYAKNSIVVTFSIIVIQTVIMVPAAYAFAKYDFPCKGVLFGLVLVAFMIPSQVTFISTYMMMADWKILNTLLPQIIPFGANAFGIFLLRQSFMQIPEEIIEAAKLDNAGEIKIMTRIMLPMSMSTMITIALFSFISHWNAYFWPLVVTNSEKIRPLTIAIERMKDLEYGVNWNVLMAGNTLLVLPVLVIFIFASKKIIQAFAYRGMK